jgi:hypothetical protein
VPGTEDDAEAEEAIVELVSLLRARVDMVAMLAMVAEVRPQSCPQCHAHQQPTNETQCATDERTNDSSS